LRHEEDEQLWTAALFWVLCFAVVDFVDEAEEDEEEEIGRSGWLDNVMGV